MHIDFHIHSRYSFDSFLEPRTIISLARSNGLDGIAVTDHDTMAGVEEFRRLASGLYIIAGQEVSTASGDILGLFLKESIRSTEGDAVIKEIRSQGGLAVLAHPFKWPHLSRTDEFLKKFDCIEVFNARNNIPAPLLENHLAKKSVDRLKLSFLAGSDVHEGFEIGCARTIFNFSPQDADDLKIKDAILKREVRVEGREVSLTREVVSHFSRNIRASIKK
jgi:predicted metal-dependent phosphoesterase TrpH